ncbi:hypothetical protein F4801DRAFT_579057 [Xylaria longipes]|nr:hypothetical protein F4801DRAFT_579057 [Xylaria longipes]
MAQQSTLLFIWTTRSKQLRSLSTCSEETCPIALDYSVHPPSTRMSKEVRRLRTASRGAAALPPARFAAVLAAAAAAAAAPVAAAPVVELDDNDREVRSSEHSSAARAPSPSSGPPLRKRTTMWK